MPIVRTVIASYFYNFYSPSECELRLYLKYHGTPAEPPSAYAQVLFRLGQRHEKNHLKTIPRYVDLSNSPSEAMREELNRGTAVIYQGTLKASTVIDNHPVEVVGIPDFVIREEAGFVIRDCKISRHADENRHPEITRQLQIYGWLLEKVTGNRPLRLEVFKGDCKLETLDYVGEPIALSHLQSLIKIISLPDEPYSPVGWSKCGNCGYNKLCWARATDQHDVAMVYDLDQNLAHRLHQIGVTTIEQLINNYSTKELSELKRPWGSREQKVGKKAERILLQAEAMIRKKELIIMRPGIPQSNNYVIFDLEGLPPQMDDIEKIYLWGMQVFGETSGNFEYSLAGIGAMGDKKGWDDFLLLSKSIFTNYGDIPFIHWAAYEKTKIKAYIDRYGDPEGIAARVMTNLVDLLPIVRDSIIIPESSYSLKVIEKHVGFKRTQDECQPERWSPEFGQSYRV